MYTLRAFADSHPMNRLASIIESSVRSEQHRTKILEQFVADFQRNPPAVTKPRFWSSMLQVLREHWHTENFGIHEASNMKWELPHKKEIAYRFEAIRLIYEDQFYRLEEDRVTHVYHEGRGAHPLKSFALRLLRLGFCDLDSKTYNARLNSEEQKMREQEDWVPKIFPSPYLENSKIVAGRNHLYNKYGLVSILEEKGIRIDVEVDYNGIESKIKDINI